MVTKKKPRTKRRKRKKKTRYKTGLHKSPKCKNKMEYRSGWELTVAKHLDQDDSVLSYEYEPFFIEYVSNKKTGRRRKYYPDFLVHYSDGPSRLIEVKRQNQLNNLTVRKKAEAAELWCKQNKMIYEFWTDPQIKVLMKIQKIKAKLEGK